MRSGVLWDAFLSQLRNLPFDLEFSISNKCNLRCLQCDVWRYYEENPEKSKEELTTKEIKDVFSSYDRFSVIGITGGEPFLREDLPQIVNILSQTQKRLKMLFITTNGQATKKIVKNIQETLENRDAKKHKFMLTQLVSLDGQRDLHNYIRGIKGAYNKTVETIKRLSDLRSSHDLFEVGTVTCCSPFNIDRFSEVINEIARLRDEYDLEPSFCIWFEGQLYKNLGEYRNVRVEEFREKLIDLIPEIKRAVRKKGTLLSTGRGIFYDLLDEWLKNPTKQVVPCGGAKIRYFLDPYGNVYPCTIFNANIGNLRYHNYNFIKLIHSDARRKVRRLVERESCPICCNTCETIPAMMAHPFRTFIRWMESKRN